MKSHNVLRTLLVISFIFAGSINPFIVESRSDGKVSPQTTRTVEINVDISYGEIINQYCTDWSSCRNASSGTDLFHGAEFASIQSAFAPESPYGPYLVKRLFLFFDTSSIPAGAQITNVNLHFHTKSVEGNKKIHVVLSSANIPLTFADFSNLQFISGGSTTPGLTWNEISFNESAFGWITRGGMTKLALIGEYDLTDTAPTGINTVILEMADSQDLQPYLEISYQESASNNDISGHITDSNRNPIAGVTVVATGPVTKTVSSNNAGYYEFSNLPAGSYIVTPSLDQHVFTPPAAFVTVPSTGSLVSFTATPANISFTTISLPLINRFHQVTENRVLRLSVTLDNKPVKAFIYRIDGNTEQELGYTDSSGELLTTYDPGQLPLLGSFTPKFMAVLENGTRIEDVFQYSVTAKSPYVFNLDQATANALNKTIDLKDSPDFDEYLNGLHIKGLPTEIEIFLLLIDFFKYLASFRSQAGDVIVTTLYTYEANDPSIPTITRADEYIQRNGQIVVNETYWCGNYIHKIAATSGLVQSALGSPANLYLTDPEGRITGVNPDTGGVVNEIPDSYYSGTGTEPQIILVFDPDDGNFSSSAVGNDTGTIHLNTWSITPSGPGQQESITSAIIPGQTITQKVIYRDIFVVYLPLISTQ